MEHDLLDEVVLLDEAGEPARFSHILTFLYEGERYIALSPLEEEASEEEAEVVLLHVVPEGEEALPAWFLAEVVRELPALARRQG